MDMLILNKHELIDNIKSLFKDYEIVGPSQLDGKLYFRPVKSMDEVVWDFVNPVNNIKDFFFPPSQVLYELRQDRIKAFEPDTKKKRIILFAKSCDTRALNLLDKLFIGDYKDTSYTARRETTTIIGLSCLEPADRCFCISLGGGPFATKGMDVSISPVRKDKFLLHILTDKGKDIIAEQGTRPEREELSLTEALKQKAEEAIKRKINIPSDFFEKFDSDYWKGVSQACIKCGICTYLCPACHCFDIIDEGYFRIRCWDTCSSDTFTKMAAGEDHRKQKYKKYRQRIYHKFQYYKENFGEIACVGCGRCTTYCPVKMDIVEIVNNS